MVDYRDNENKFAYVVGYMLKILKSKKNITRFRDEFAAIRHGDYDKFINIIKAPIPFMVIYENGVIRSGVNSVKDECDFFGLLAAGPSLDKFYNTCHSYYGDISDLDFNDEVYRRLSIFEIRIRMHARIHNKISTNEKLEVVIDSLCTALSFNNSETALLHEGRKFLNKIKHPIDNATWKANITLFDEAYILLDKKGIRII